MYNASSNSWTTFPNGLGQARHSLAAAALPSGLVFFAGGFSSGAADVVPALQSSLRACVARRCCDDCWSLSAAFAAAAAAAVAAAAVAAAATAAICDRAYL